MENISSGFDSLVTKMVIKKTKREQYLEWSGPFYRPSLSPAALSSLLVTTTDRVAGMRIYPPR